MMIAMLTSLPGWPLMRPICRVVLLLALAASACEKNNPAAPTPNSPSANTRVVSLTGSLAFGAVEIGRTSDLTLTIVNTGTGTLSVSGITSPHEYALNWTNGTIAAGGSQLVTVRFAPTAARSYDGTLTVNGDHTGGTNTASLSGTGTLPASPPAPPPPPPTSATAYDEQILGLVNDHRRSIGKPALAMNQVIWIEANGHSLNMASRTVAFGHDGFDARVAAIRAALGSGGSAAENVAMGYSSAESVVNAWLGSAGHRANIEGNATRTGVSAVKSSDGVWYYTQVFY
jgi:uncharacterized protein YkwD